MIGPRRAVARVADSSRNGRSLNGHRPTDDRTSAGRSAAAALDSPLVQALLDATLDAIRLVDLEGRTLVANATSRQLAREMRLPDEGTIYERWKACADQTTDPDGFRAALDALVADPEREALDEVCMAATGRTFMRYSAPVRDASGALLGRLLVSRDVTAERELERLRTEVLATVSHELRTPLTGILGFAELLLQPGLDADTQRSHVETIHHEAARLTDLLDNFLDLQRFEDGRGSLELAPFDVRDVLEREAKIFSVQSDRHTIALDLPAESLVAVGEAKRIEQVVANLLSNAIKYSPAGGVVRLSAEARERALRIAVSDAGLGISPDQQSKIFTKFFRVDSSDTRRIDGTGLGLALAREVIEAHNGRIGFESTEGEGSTFWFELPVPRPADEAGRLRVLVIEDDPGMASLVSEQLSADDYVVEVAATGADGLRLATEDPPALICLDVSLPGPLNGWEVLEKLKASPATAGVPVIVVTGHDGRAQAASLGAAGFIAKPYLEEQLGARVASILSDSAAP